MNSQTFLNPSSLNNIETVDKPSLNYSISSINDCTFCDKKSIEVLKMFKGKYACICNECVELCEEIIEEENFEGTKNSNNKTDKPKCSFCLNSRLNPDITHMVVKDSTSQACICNRCILVFADELKFI